MKIKNCYKARAEKDRQAFSEILKELVGDKFEEYTPEQIEVFTKNWMNLTAIEYRTLQTEFEQINTEFIWEGEDANKWYFCIRAVDEFQTANGRIATSDDKEAIAALVSGYLEKYSVDTSQFNVEEKYIEEM